MLGGQGSPVMLTSSSTYLVALGAVKTVLDFCQMLVNVRYKSGLYTTP